MKTLHDYWTDREHRLEAWPFKTAIINDAGHGGTSQDPQPADYNIGTDTQQKETLLRTTWKLPKPPDGQSYTAYYGRGDGFVSERFVTLDVSAAFEAETLRRIGAAGLQDVIFSHTTRRTDVILTIDERTAQTRATLLRPLGDKEIAFKPEEVYAAGNKAHVAVFVSLHIEGSDPLRSGTVFYYRQGQLARQTPLISELTAAIQRASRSDPRLKMRASPVVDVSSRWKKGLGVLKHYAPNMFATLGELEAMSGPVGYENLRDPTFLANIGRALADGVWAFVANLYEDAKFVSDPFQKDMCHLVAQAMREVATR